ncbi:MAG: DUF2835 domain-containing protein [Endozoicomonadaceae bacterium]|nr:DUF2835 domain-containing protein [Endozoicomonadaceae bacterium]
MKKKSIFKAYLTSEQVLEYYKGKKNSVRVKTEEGQSMSIPFDVLLKYVTHDGIGGTFEIHYTDDGQFQSIHKI